MDSKSQKTLRRVEQNDDQLTTLRISSTLLDVDGRFASSDASDYSRLGAAIGNNTHLTKLVVNPAQTPTLDIANHEFFDGLKRNSSISDLQLNCNNGHILVGGTGHEILKSYQKIGNNLTRLCINRAVLDNGGGNVITETLRLCTNLKTINLPDNNITDEQLLPMVDAIKGGCNSSLEKLYLYLNRIGNAGCHALATLLEHTNSNLQFLNLNSNQIGNEGATVIADSLVNNTTLRQLYLRENHFDQSVVGIFCTVLCNTSCVNDTYLSNHTLDKLFLERQGQHADHLFSLRRLNNGTNKSHVAIKKILKYHPNIDMKPLFEWDADGEQTLKSLPYAIGWFGRAEEAGARAEEREDYMIEQKKLSAIFQFAKSMPLMFVSASHIKVDDRKRKRGVL